MKAFMFHYVREENDAQEYSRYFDLTEFRSLVRGLKERYSFKSIEEAYETGSPGDIALTFDDGLKDHLDVAEFLHSIDVPASFYIPAQPNENQGLLTVHLAHQIVSESGPKALGLLFDELEKSGIEREEWVDKEKEGRFKTRYSTHRNEDQEIRLFKRLINYELPVSLAKTLVSNIADRIGLEPKPEEVYLTREEIRHVSDLGFRIGSHGITHVPISRLSSREQLKELSLSKERLEALIDKPVTSPPWVCTSGIFIYDDAIAVAIVS